MGVKHTQVLYLVSYDNIYVITVTLLMTFLMHKFIKYCYPNLHLVHPLPNYWKTNW